jgi:hypothetical protein
LNLRIQLTTKGKETYLPADVEGHIGIDGRRYIIDASRVFPAFYIQPISDKLNAPSGNNNNMKWVHLYKMCRPELLQFYSTPLCSDAYSSFIDNIEERFVEFFFFLLLLLFLSHFYSMI